MPDYRRNFVPGGTYFFTVALLERKRDLLVAEIELLRYAVRRVKRLYPFDIVAWVVLPDHLHSTAWMQEVGQRREQLPSVWTLPPGDDDFSNRWKAIKIRFVQALPRTERRSKVRVAKGERGIWQHRFWEHAIRDQRDYNQPVRWVERSETHQKRSHLS
jgi:putative transposase